MAVLVWELQGEPYNPQSLKFFQVMLIIIQVRIWTHVPMEAFSGPQSPTVELFLCFDLSLSIPGEGRSQWWLTPVLRLTLWVSIPENAGQTLIEQSCLSRAGHDCCGGGNFTPGGLP